MYMLVAIHTKLPYAYGHQHTGMVTHNRTFLLLPYTYIHVNIIVDAYGHENTIVDEYNHKNSIVET